MKAFYFASFNTQGYDVRGKLVGIDFLFGFYNFSLL